MNNIEMKNRWIALYVENEVGVLAKVSGLFSAKSYNLQSLTGSFCACFTNNPESGLRRALINFPTGSAGLQE